MPSSPSLVDPTAAAAMDDQSWVALHVPRFQAALPHYEILRQFLAQSLDAMNSILGLQALTSSRTKELPSIAGKLLLKKSRFTDPQIPLPPDPLVRMTDVCGGRIIVRTSGEVEKVCALIQRAFEIDHANSEDVRQRLKPTEFGYRSVHYIVTIREDLLRAAGISVSVPSQAHGFGPELAGPTAAHRPLKAEIQELPIVRSQRRPRASHQIPEIETRDLQNPFKINQTSIARDAT